MKKRKQHHGWTNGRRWCGKCGRQHRRKGAICRGAHLIGKQAAYKLRRRRSRGE